MRLVQCCLFLLLFVSNVQGGPEQLHKLLLIVLEISLHDVHARSKETLKRSNIQYCGRERERERESNHTFSLFTRLKA